VEEEAATRPDSLHFFSQENFILIREKARKSQGILKRDVGGNHVSFSIMCTIITLAWPVLWLAKELVSR